MYNIKIDLKKLILHLISIVMLFITTIAMGIFIKGNTDIFLWDEKARITIVIINSIYIFFSFFFFSFVSIELKKNIEKS